MGFKLPKRAKMTEKADTRFLCPCHSSKKYDECCAPYHRGMAAPTALALMRSRYSAYALKLVEYVVKTTHPKSPLQPLDAASLKDFCDHTRFLGLEIVDFQDGQETATVIFRPRLMQNGKELVYTEKSLFEKVDGRWYYKESV